MQRAVNLMIEHFKEFGYKLLTEIRFRRNARVTFLAKVTLQLAAIYPLYEEN